MSPKGGGKIPSELEKKIIEDFSKNIKSEVILLSTLEKRSVSKIKAKLIYNGPIEAPIMKDDVLGKLKITFKDELIDEYDLLAFEDVKKLNIFSSF